MTILLIHIKFIHFVFQHCNELNRDWNLAMEHTCQEEYNNNLRSQKEDTFISSNNATALDSLHVMFGSTYWTSALHWILLCPSMFFPRHAALQFTIEKNSDYYKRAKTAGFFNPSNMHSDIPHGSLLFNLTRIDQHIQSEIHNGTDHGDPLDLFASQLIPSSLGSHPNSVDMSIQDLEPVPGSGDDSDDDADFTPGDRSFRKGSEEMSGNPGSDEDDEDDEDEDEDDDDNDNPLTDRSSKKRGAKGKGRKSKTKKPKSAEFIFDSDDFDSHASDKSTEAQAVLHQEALTHFHNMIPIFKALMRSCAFIQVQNSDTDIHGDSLSTIDHRDVFGISCLFGRLITSPNTRLATHDLSFLKKADTMLDKLAKDHMQQMSRKKRAEVLKDYDATLAGLFGQEDHPSCEQAVANAAEVLEKEWQKMNDQVQNPSADEEDQTDMDLDIEEDVDMGEAF
jgi:hypothetical protein